MNINRQTYEEFFLLYVDNELSAGQKRAVEDFVKENPDLEQEFSLLKNTVFTPDENICFDDREMLYRSERRVIPVLWYRIAAAAILVVALTVSGWIYLGSKTNSIQSERVASKELVNHKVEDNTIEKKEPAVQAVANDFETPAERISSKPVRTSISSVYAVNVMPDRRPAASETEPLIAEVPARDAEIPDPAELRRKPGPAEMPTEILDVAVAARNVQEDEYVTGASLQEPVIQYGEAEENDMIYFANTALPKKTKLRGIFRKATRILDKVTSLQ